MEEPSKIVLEAEAEGVIRCRECGQTAICHAGDFNLYSRDGWPRCPLDGSAMRFIPREELVNDKHVTLNQEE
jgi:hypothetical protein